MAGTEVKITGIDDGAVRTRAQGFFLRFSGDG